MGGAEAIMPATIIMGGQWGDEGKGKLTDALAARADVVVRANGGGNAGHTIETDRGVFKLHLVPSGILNPGCTCVIGAGVVVNPQMLLEEMADLQQRGIDLTGLQLSDRAHVVMPYHPILDRLEETERGDDEIGTTLTGNGPAYADKVARRGIRIADLLDEAALLPKLTRALASKNQTLTCLYDEQALDTAEIYRDLIDWGTQLAGHVVASEMVVQDALADGKEILIECAQGAMLDVDYGTYPYVTSSSPTAAGACQGAGVAPTQVHRVIGVFKAYTTRVGSGPLPTELRDEVGALIRERGREYGTTTGRPRRVGWFDAVAARYVARMNGLTEVALTLLDVLDVFDEVKVCTGYRMNDVEYRHLPSRDDLVARVTPIYETLPGWTHPTSEARTQADLPDNAVAYIRFIQEAIGVPIGLIGVGPNREQLVPLAEAPAETVALAN